MRHLLAPGIMRLRLWARMPRLFVSVPRGFCFAKPWPFWSRTDELLVARPAVHSASPDFPGDSFSKFKITLGVSLRHVSFGVAKHDLRGLDAIFRESPYRHCGEVGSGSSSAWPARLRPVSATLLAPLWSLVLSLFLGPWFATSGFSAILGACQTHPRLHAGWPADNWPCRSGCEAAWIAFAVPADVCGGSLLRQFAVPGGPLPIQAVKNSMPADRDRATAAKSPALWGRVR